MGNNYGVQCSLSYARWERSRSVTSFSFSVVTCEAQKEPDHGSLDCTHPFGLFSYNSTCSLSCNRGYLPSSPETTMRCMSSGEWSAAAPSCKGNFQCALKLLTPNCLSSYPTYNFFLLFHLVRCILSMSCVGNFV